MDFSKAFDCVLHGRLLQKLECLNINHWIIHCIREFLSNIKQSVAVLDHLSTSTNVKSGVPQGSVPGPLPFLIYIDDLPVGISSSIRNFADDCVLCRKIVTINGTHDLQNDINLSFYVVVSGKCELILKKM